MRPRGGATKGLEGGEEQLERVRKGEERQGGHQFYNRDIYRRDPGGTGGIDGGDPLPVGGEMRDGGRGGGDPLAVGGETQDGGRGGGDPLAVGGETRDGGQGGGDPLAVGGEMRDGGRGGGDELARLNNDQLGFSDLGLRDLGFVIWSGG
ncbi:hypothetical protein LR48_Vigan07g175600 [Vigna angularis]|uniref:Uncharacterized protein n=1 Tax=Phaseolus angularis TaxID=3914 RepID=A0A0L9UZQ4_PHAAN|nr:hypothetical protein LR48_Vigan07g175600 [Vigna angularis]